MAAATAADAADTADLRAAIDRVLRRLAVLLDEPTVEVGDPAAQGAPGREASPGAPEGTLARVAQAFGLSPFATEVLALLAAAELDPRATRLLAAAGATDGRCTVGLALAALEGADWSVLTPTAPLRHHRLVELGGGPLTGATLGLDERILHALCGVDTLDARLAVRLRPTSDPGTPPPSLARTVAAVRAAAATGPVQLVGSSAVDRAAVATAALTDGTEVAGPPVWSVLASELPRAVEEQDAFARLWGREVRLGGARLVVEVDGHADPAVLAAVRRLVGRLEGQVVIAVATPVADGPDVVVAVPRVSMADQRMLWHDRLGVGADATAAVEVMVERFDLGWRPVVRAAELARVADDTAGARADAAARCIDAAQAVTRPAFEGLADRLHPTATRDRLAVPEQVAAVLDDIVRHVRHRRRVHDDWGLDGSRGRGMTALFSGPSGTGKTLAAETIASELSLELWRVDLSAVVSKYIGETEKQLRRVLDAAEAGTVVLLFDEADALFGTRTELRDSHDRYANQEVAYLLQRLETFRGIAILTTNLRSAIDEAFLRRFRFVVSFPFPDEAQRAAIWRVLLPDTAPFQPLDEQHLARLGLSGGHLRNVAVTAAVLGAADGGVVTGDHVRRAVRQEYAKLGRTLTSAEESALVAATRGGPDGGGRP